jgi:hypothetical protein
MPKKEKVPAVKKKTPAPHIAPLQRGLPMPQYDYQNPRTGSFVTRCDEVEDRKNPMRCSLRCRIQLMTS